jgi:hypothetical protein
VLLTAVLTGATSTLATVAALKVHISYHRETLDRHDRRITALEKGAICER